MRGGRQGRKRLREWRKHTEVLEAAEKKAEKKSVISCQSFGRGKPSILSGYEQGKTLFY